MLTQGVLASTSPLRILGAVLLFAASTAGCGDRPTGHPSSNSDTTQRQPSELDALKLAAEKGDAPSQFALAKRYEEGNGVEKDSVAAFRWALKAAESGHPQSMLYVAKALQAGAGVPLDYKRAEVWIQKAAEAGDAEGQYLWGDVNAFVMSSGVEIVGNGESLRANADQFTTWMSRSSEQGYLPAKHALGLALLLGAKQAFGTSRAIPPNVHAGLSLLRQAADAGYWESVWAMAVLTQVGFGNIEKNKALSDAYWATLEKQSDPDVQRRIAFIYFSTDPKTYKMKRYKGRDLKREDSNSLALEWFTKSAEQGDRESLYQVGVCYRYGLGSWRRDERAIDYWKRAAEKGHFDAQRDLAFSYLDGTGVTRDYAEGFKWMERAAQAPLKYSDTPKVQNALGALYEYGWGVEKDPIVAYAWYNIAAAGGYAKSKGNLTRVEKTLPQEGLREAQRLSTLWKPGEAIVRTEAKASQGTAGSTTKQAASGALKAHSQGTGFMVSSAGNVITNQHVVDGCVEIRIPAANAVAKLIVADAANDLALLKIDATDRSVAVFPDSDELRQGEDVFVFGFPLDGFLPDSGNITPGIVSALAGPGNNSSLVQITAPVQPGNSGGPLLNRRGKVVGIVVGKADALKIAKITGDVPQNINFAIAPKTVRAFLVGNNVDFQRRGDLFSLTKDSVAIADAARKASVKIECWR